MSVVDIALANSLKITFNIHGILTNRRSLATMAPDAALSVSTAPPFPVELVERNRWEFLDDRYSYPVEYFCGGIFHISNRVARGFTILFINRPWPSRKLYIFTGITHGYYWFYRRGVKNCTLLAGICTVSAVFCTLFFPRKRCRFCTLFYFLPSLSFRQSFFDHSVFNKSPVTSSGIAHCFQNARL